MTTLLNDTNPTHSLSRGNSMDLVRTLGPAFATRAERHDANDTFVTDNYAALKEHRAFSLGVPGELGGGGATHAELCDMVRTLAHYCPSTALAFSMHQHLVAANVWKYRRGQPADAILRRIAERELILVSTGARDWLASNSEATRAGNGYRVTARKAFASGCEAGDMLVTSAPYEDPNAGPVVLHFLVPFTAEGVTVEQNWRVMGMRGTGSYTVILDDVYVPESALVLSRPRGEWHPVWNIILTVALPLIMSAYVGAAEAAAELVKRETRGQKNDPNLPYLLGEMEAQLVMAQLAMKDMIAIANDYDLEPVIETANAVLIRKTIAAKASLAAVEKALEAVGGRGFYRPLQLEKFVRDVHGGQFHPLPEKEQQRVSGRRALGLTPV